MNICSASTRLSICLVTLVLCGSHANAGDEIEHPTNPDWRFHLSFGTGGWENQQDLSIVSPGRFDSGPYVLEIGVDRRFAKWGKSDVYVGLDVGWMRTDTQIPGQHSGPTSDTKYFRPSVAIYMGDVDSRRFNLRAGAGYYTVASIEIIDPTTSRSFTKSAFGSFVGAGIDFPLKAGSGLNSITLDTRVQFVDFGNVTQLGSTPEKLKGPIWTVQVGWGRRF